MSLCTHIVLDNIKAQEVLAGRINIHDFIVLFPFPSLLSSFLRVGVCGVNFGRCGGRLAWRLLPRLQSCSSASPRWPTRDPTPMPQADTPHGRHEKGGATIGSRCVATSEQHDHHGSGRVEAVSSATVARAATGTQRQPDPPPTTQEHDTITTAPRPRVPPTRLSPSHLLDRTKSHLAMALFAFANHTLLFYSIVYCAGDAVGAFFYEGDSRQQQLALAWLFFGLAIFLIANSLIYYRAFVVDMDAFRTENYAGPFAGTGVSSAHLEIDKSDDDDEEEVDGGVTRRRHPRKGWMHYLKTEAGISYFLNISTTSVERDSRTRWTQRCKMNSPLSCCCVFRVSVGSCGYLVSTLINLSVALGSGTTSRRVDRAALLVELVNMLIFTIDGGLYWHVWVKEAEVRGGRARFMSMYNWANLFNTLNSAAYLAFVVWVICDRFRIASDEQAHVDAGDHDWYNDQVNSSNQKMVSRAQRKRKREGRCRSHSNLPLLSHHPTTHSL